MIYLIIKAHHSSRLLSWSLAGALWIRVAVQDGSIGSSARCRDHHCPFSLLLLWFALKIISLFPPIKRWTATLKTHQKQQQNPYSALAFPLSVSSRTSSSAAQIFRVTRVIFRRFAFCFAHGCHACTVTLITFSIQIFLYSRVASIIFAPIAIHSIGGSACVLFRYQLFNGRQSNSLTGRLSAAGCLL